MKILKRTLLSILTLILTLVLIVVALRVFYNHKYGSDSTSASTSYYTDPTNLSLYPTDIDGVEVTTVNNNTLHGFHLVPKDKKHKGIIVSYGGSDGAAGFQDAQQLAQRGYETMAVFMFGMDNQPQELSKVPLEQFDDVLDYINANVTDKGPLTVIGASKGAEYALNLATKYDEIDSLILRAPSAYNYAGLDFGREASSSWTWQGQQLPFINMKETNPATFFAEAGLPMLVGAPVEYLNVYKNAVEDDPDRDSKLIPVTDTDADILLIAGGKDMMWDSTQAAQLIQEQRPQGTTVKTYPDAGHIFFGDGVNNLSNMRIATGGTQAANEAAHEDSQKSIEDFLEQHHR
ncbi:acyl-CoA thioester hydrolase/BAAT C-terminal domain-containing protein [Corynebacterium aquilae]|uniref:Acyl-CoA thioesterase n=1 Tax=Corynebacterium aquilae DSM 44791 TaxID=1431546 RepID=A0A1L7CIA0_9CORY|nr:acyl-CoA thioester hydrolase/BAAT C-terminal domain-containing protein [Corynebacterium aquilae]APT85581.1 acyl-CoA thioesterase [Corynebacterium aquilae DSM 44791]